MTKTNILSSVGYDYLKQSMLKSGQDFNSVEIEGKVFPDGEHYFRIINLERLYMVSSIRFVHQAFIAQGSGKLDFSAEIKTIRPDIFFVNADGDSPEKRQFVESLGIRYVVSDRIPKNLLPIRSTTAIREELKR